MPGKPIQEQFGEQMMNAFAEFARADLKAPGEYEADEFAHISDLGLRRDLAQVLYGARWLYKLGLALLVQDEERAAHVRAQLVDYGSLVEGMLLHCVSRAIQRKYTKGDSYEYRDPDFKRRKINWNVKDIDAQVSRQSLWWLIRVSADCDVITNKLATDLDWLRLQRNTVHIRQRSKVGQKAFLAQSKKAFEFVVTTITQTKSWCDIHP